MKTVKKIIFGLLAIASFSSCEKIIELDLNNAISVVVVSGQLSNQSEFWMVNLSWSKEYYDQTEIKYVTDAEVTIEVSDGTIDTLFYDTLGNYKSKSMNQCEIGKTYTLNVKHHDKLYTASEKLFYQEPIELLQSFYLPKQNGFIPEGNYVFEYAKEYEPYGDFYLWRITKNNLLMTDSIGYLLDTDEFRETGFFNFQIDPNDPLKDIDKGILPRPFPWPFQIGDSVVVEQLRISEKYYDFMFSFATQQQRSGTPFDPPPANPPSNIKGGAYGYFSVVNITKKSVVIQ
ncbi:MAG: DUF4249 domain-containing protein [Flavobacteriales bacterium]|nr:DUF4249 domain-containing protein [Flavobacteriales bacterium]